MSADAAAVGNIITVFPKLISGRNVPEKGIGLEADAKGAIRYIRSKIIDELRECCFDLCLGTKQLTNRKATITELELEDGASITIVRYMSTEVQLQLWKQLEEQGAIRDEVVFDDEETIKKIGWPCIAHALSQTRASKIYMEHCGLGYDEAEIVAEVLTVNPLIKELYMSMNYLGVDGGEAMAQAMEVNKTLSSIGLEGDSIEDGGAVAIAKVLRNNKNVEHIFLQGNSINDNGAVALAEAIEANMGLVSVNIIMNSYGSVGKKALLEAQEARKRQGKPIVLHLDK